jgi:predicted RNA-binding Zn ribbon-like protein
MGETGSEAAPASRVEPPLSAGHENRVSGHAPGRLELVRAFLSLHDHAPGVDTSFPPSAGTIVRWLTDNELTGPGEASAEDLAWASSVRDALHAKVEENSGTPRDEDATGTLNRAAMETGLRLCFGCDDDNPIHTDAGGVRGAVGRLLGTAFLAELDGTWERLRVCSSPTCNSVFFDRSKNRSGRWCDMKVCGNKSKVRAYRERQRAGTA